MFLWAQHCLHYWVSGSLWCGYLALIAPAFAVEDVRYTDLASVCAMYASREEGNDATTWYSYYCIFDHNRVYTVRR